MAVIVLNMS